MSTQIDSQAMTLRRFCFLLFFFWFASAVASPLLKTAPTSESIKSNHPRFRKTPVVILVSVDGVRHDYPSLHEMTTLQEMAQKGASMEGLIPVYPSKTFPNHYSIVTGMRPAEHRIWENNFYDPVFQKTYSPSDPFAVQDGRWYGGIPLWSLAESQGMRTASYFWVGSEAKIAGHRPTYMIPYNPQVPNQERVEQVLKWVALPYSKRPGFITLYFSMVDNAGHSYGPTSKETREAAQEADSLIRKLWEGLKNSQVPYVLVIVSDHGMTSLDPKKIKDLSNVVTEDDFEIQGSGSFVTLHLKKPERRVVLERKLRDFLEPEIQVVSVKDNPNSIPLAYPKGTLTIDPRLGDFVLAAHSPWYLDLPKRRKSQQAASHGWSPQNREMQGIFFAVGTGIPEGRKLPPLENTVLYSWIAKTLGLSVRSESSNDVLLKLLKAEPKKTREQ